MQVLYTLAVIVAFVAPVRSFGEFTQTGLQVKTSNGVVEGTLDVTNNVRLFQGIPYAKPPVGDLRWEYPQTPAPFSSVYKANFIAPGCPQDCQLPPGNCPLTYSEDCLYLTVFAPTVPPKEEAGYPVLFWVHGGAFEQGLGDCALYNGTTFAQQGIMVVAINYRLGALGFMANKDMKGNYGVLDQRMALQWAQDNAAAFGGDPKRVTLAGQSAGAMSTGIHMVSPGSKGLFSKAILESNPFGLPYHTRETADTNAGLMFKYLSCSDLACMKGKSAEEIVKAQKESVKIDRNTLFINFLPFAPMIEKDGEIPEQPLYAMAAGKMHPMPVLAGSMYDEGQLFVYEMFTKPMSKTSYHATLDAIFGLHRSKQIKNMYPMDCEGCPSGNTDGRAAFNVLATDLLFYCPLRNVTRGAQASLAPTSLPFHIYRFKHVLSFDCWGPGYPFCVGVVCHGSELPFVFNVFGDGVNNYAPTAAEVQLAKDMGNAWSNFMHSADPNQGPGSSYKQALPVPQTYPLYAEASDELVVLDEPEFFDASKVRSSYCDTWDQLGYFW